MLVDLGDACSAYQHYALTQLDCERIACDETWSFFQSKAKNVPAEHEGEFGWGDVWTWTTIDADTKLVPAWYVGDRSADSRCPDTVRRILCTNSPRRCPKLSC